MRFTLHSLISVAVIATSEASIQSPRELSQSAIAGFLPATSVTDHNAIDLDQKLIEGHVASDSTFALAKKIYENGAHSKSFARITLDEGSELPTDLPKATGVTGVAADGTTTVVGGLLNAQKAGDTVLEIQYEVISIQESYVNCQVGGRESDGNLEGCFAQSGTVSIDGVGTPFPYTYVPTLDNDNGRTIQGFSTGADTKMRENGSGKYYADFQKFFDYYGKFDYADDWIQAALSGGSTNLINGNANWQGKSAGARAQGVKKGTAYMAIAMYVIRELEDAIDDCFKGCSTAACNDDAVHALDEAVAFYTGSLEGIDGDSSGVLMHALADKRCTQFNTCNSAGTSKVNDAIFDEFNRMKGNLISAEKKCDAARANKERIASLLFVPMIQGTLRYAYILGKGSEPDDDIAEAEGAVFAASVLPVVNFCNDGAANTIYSNMRVGSTSVSFEDVKNAFEGTYSCMKISCEDVGGYWDATDKVYFPGAQPCRSNNLKSSGISAGAIVGIVVGVLAVVALAAMLLCRRKTSGIEFKSDGGTEHGDNSV